MPNEWIGVPVFGSAPFGAEAVIRPSAYAVIANCTHVAVVRTPQGLFLPGGGMESHETPADTAVREAREECGLTVDVGSWSCRAVDFVWSPTEQTHFEKRSTFVDATMRGDATASEEPDHELDWLLPNQAITDLAHPSHRWAVAEWLQRTSVRPPISRMG